MSQKEESGFSPQLSGFFSKVFPKEEKIAPSFSS